MNLKDLTQEVNTALDYNPDLSAYKDQVARVINRHYLQISSQYPWLFRQKTEKLTLRADIAGNATTNKLRIGIDDRTYDTSNIGVFVGDENTLSTREMLGNTLVFDYTSENKTQTNRLSYGHGTSELEFTITGIFDRSEDGDGYGGGHGDDSDGGLGARYGGTASDEWPDGYAPGSFQTCGIVLDRPIISPSVVATASTAVLDDDSRPIGGSFTDASITTKYYDDWKIEFRQYYLPADCIEVLGIMDRGLKTPVHTDPAGSGATVTAIKTAPKKGNLVFLDSAKEEYEFLDRDSPGDPVIAVEGMAVHHDAPMVPPIVRFYDETTCRDEDHANANASFRLYGGDTYEYCYTFVYAGIESPPSPVTKITLPNDYDYYGARLTFQSIEGVFRRKSSYGPTSADKDSDRSTRAWDKADVGHRMTGRVVRVYRRKVMEPGDGPSAVWQGHQRWMHIGDNFTDQRCWDRGRKQNDWNIEGEGAKNFYNEIVGEGIERGALLGWPEAFWMRLGLWTYHDGEMSKIKILDESGPRQTIKVYRPPSQDMDVEIRYLSRPKRLVADADTPEWPVQYHHLLVYMCLSDICLQHGMATQSQLYERKAEDLLERMRQKYLARANRKYIRGSFDRAVFSGERWGTPSKIG
tara:strand:+ start:1509 stop:3419 length:1911 start_codon:yes stop_codon:yes gene_type:complete